MRDTFYRGISHSFLTGITLFYPISHSILQLFPIMSWTRHINRLRTNSDILQRPFFFQPANMARRHTVCESDCISERVKTVCVAKYPVNFLSISSWERVAEWGLYFERCACIPISSPFKSLSAKKLTDLNFTLSACAAMECIGSVACNVI